MSVAAAAEFPQGPRPKSETATKAIEDLVVAVLTAAACCSHHRAGVEASKRLVLPEVAIVSQGWTLVAEDGGFSAGTSRQQKLRLIPRNYRRLARFFAALDNVYRLNAGRRSARRATQRELFYRLVAEEPDLFKAQPDMDAAIRDVCGALQIGRPHLGVLTTEKGLVAGAIQIHGTGSDAASSAARSMGGLTISQAMLDLSDEAIDVSGAHFVLVVEKDTFFQHLLQGRLLASLPLILVTGRGYPDMLTRRLLQRLHRIAPQLRQAYLGDYDPHGVSIYLTYRRSCPFLRWLGMHAADVAHLPDEAALALTARDVALQQSLAEDLAVTRDEALAAEVAAMRRLGRKFELEALHLAYGHEALAKQFVPEKLLKRAWL
eukprot:TRINITY_DN27102_c0_g1_i1.p1 TRINITY_DN27102_c0_g1~~TRINITY_DN27102_c0_g1_i1.p1  ORF type:complete len:376 (-),score=82.91 TRINITY_DN27102_c0_g1_i1:683-1810(-)